MSDLSLSSSHSLKTVVFPGLTVVSGFWNWTQGRQQQNSREFTTNQPAKLQEYIPIQARITQFGLLSTLAVVPYSSIPQVGLACPLSRCHNAHGGFNCRSRDDDEVRCSGTGRGWLWLRLKGASGGGRCSMASATAAQKHRGICEVIRFLLRMWPRWVGNWSRLALCAIGMLSFTTESSVLYHTLVIQRPSQVRGTRRMPFS